MTGLEAISALLGAIAVCLGVRRNVLTFPVAVASVVLFGWIVLGKRLYSDAVLQAFFVATNLYGWVKWRRAEAVARTIAVRRLTRRRVAMWVAGWAAISVGWAWVTATFTDAVWPWWDAPTFVASVAAQILMGQRYLENWIVWIAVDVALIPLYHIQHLDVFAALYVVYLILSAWGWVDWRRALASVRLRGAG